MSTATEKTTTKKKMCTFKSCDDELFEVDESIAMMSPTIQRIIEEGCSDNGIPIHDVTAEILDKVAEYCKKHVVVKSNNAAAAADSSCKDDLKEWDEAFIDVDQETLIEIILTASYLDIQDLVDLACTRLWGTY